MHYNYGHTYAEEMRAYLEGSHFFHIRPRPTYLLYAR